MAAATPTPQPVTLERLDRARSTMARIVTVPAWKIHLPVFERIDAECAAMAAKSSALDRARQLARNAR